jgi:anti-sigma regulatory factor (Ser/Thr protein kinase)
VSAVSPPVRQGSDVLMPFTSVRHVLTARPGAVPEARQLMRSYVEEHCPNADAIRENVALAVSEAVGNAVRHAYDDDSGRVEIAARHAADWLEVVVRDWGKGWRPSSDPGLGLGVPLMRSMAELAVTAPDGGGCRVSLRVPCRRRSDTQSEPAGRSELRRV